jgi:DNA polymerase III epsilon subunit-like protein
MHEGIELKTVLKLFGESQERASFLIGHNASFDGKIVRSGCYRVGIEPNLTKMPTLDTMLLSTKFCQLPKPSGRGGFKWPKLEELHSTLFAVCHDNAHDALGDVIATKKCFFELKKLGIITGDDFSSAVAKHKLIEQKVKEKAERESFLKEEYNLKIGFKLSEIVNE